MEKIVREDGTIDFDLLESITSAEFANFVKDKLEYRIEHASKFRFVEFTIDSRPGRVGTVAKITDVVLLLLVDDAICYSFDCNTMEMADGRIHQDFFMNWMGLNSLEKCRQVVRQKGV